MEHCLCCTETLIRHIRDGQLTGYCSRCRQYMPILPKRLQKGKLTPKTPVNHTRQLV